MELQRRANARNVSFGTSLRRPIHIITVIKPDDQTRKIARLLNYYINIPEVMKTGLANLTFCVSSGLVSVPLSSLLLDIGHLRKFSGEHHVKL